MPERIEHVLFTSSGTEAVEAALKLGRAAAGRSRVFSASKGFHGLTLGSLSANGGAEWSERFGPLLPDFDRVPWNDLDALEQELQHEDVALFLVEPVQGKGVNLPAPGYLEGAQELCRRYGTYFVLDEVQTGFGRTGKMFALEHWGLEPDIVTVSKSLSGGYVPVGACLMSKEVYDNVFDSLEHAVSHGSTFAPNDLAMAAGLATLHELDEQGLVERSARLGNLLLERTEPFVERYDVVREVRGLGLMWAIEFQEPEGGSRTWRMLERRQPGIFSQLVAVPLFSEHAILIQTAGHQHERAQGHPPADGDRGGYRVLRLRARADAPAGAEDPGGDDALRAQGGARRPEALSRRRALIQKLLVANRGEIALRVFRACRELGIATVAVVAPDDTGSLHARSADETVEVLSYLFSEEQIRAAKQTGADAIHPGYGFLAESAISRKRSRRPA